MRLIVLFLFLFAVAAVVFGDDHWGDQTRSVAAGEAIAYAAILVLLCVTERYGE